LREENNMTDAIYRETDPKSKATISIYVHGDIRNPFGEDEGLPDIVTWIRSYNFTTDKTYSKYTPEEFLELGYTVMPLYATIHGGISFYAYKPNDIWDSGFAGFMYFKDTYPNQNTELDFKGALELLNDYCMGNCYGYSITNSEGEELDSCWGFFGDYKDNDLVEARLSLQNIVAPDTLPLFRRIKNEGLQNTRQIPIG
jgi:hypothetical protein